ncbi:MAG: hypothetical protein C4320_04020 [Armatimonadota bacterium]
MAKALKTLVDEALLTVPEVDVHHARKMIEEPAEAGTGWLILDVREPEEYAAGHLPGAINVPRGTLEVAADHDHPRSGTSGSRTAIVRSSVTVEADSARPSPPGRCR